MEYEMKVKVIGERLKELRRAAGYTSYETFAVDNDFERMTIWRAEAGESISLRTLNRILEKLDVSFEEFFKGTGI